MSQHKREEWQKLQEEVLARAPGTGGLTLENLRECSGLELFQKMIAGEFSLALRNRSRTRLAPTPTNI